MIEVNEHFSVVEEGDGWIVVDKGSPLIVHPANNRGDEPSLLGGVQRYLAYELECGARLSIINRLDRETSGLVLLATRKSVAREMSRAMERRLVKKRYKAIVVGWPEWDEVVVDAPILRRGDVMDSEIYVRQMVHDLGKESKTRFSVKDRYLIGGKRIALIDAEPQTGRMHQIRVHAAHVGHALVGDKIYNEPSVYLDFIVSGFDGSMLEELLLRRHALHASGLSLEVGDCLYSWEIDLAADLTHFLAGAKKVDG